MANQLPKKTKEKPEVSKSPEPETSPPETETVHNEKLEESPSSEIAAKALPNIEPHVYKPEPPATTTPAQPLDTDKETAVETTQEQKPSLLEEDDIAANEPLFEPEVKSRKKLYIVGAVILIIVSLISAWLFMNFNKNKSTEEKKPETAQSEQISAPVVTEVKESETSFDRSKITLEVLNGSGIAGEAKKIADSLSALKYQIVKVGNAQENSQTSQILISNDFKNFQNEFLKDLEGIINEATISGNLEDSTASARIIIGKN